MRFTGPLACLGPAAPLTPPPAALPAAPAAKEDGLAAPTLLGLLLVLLVAAWFIGTWLMIRRHAGMRVWKSMEDTVKATSYYGHSFALHPDLMERDKEAKLARVAGHDTTNMVWGDHRDAMLRKVASGVSVQKAHSDAQQAARMMRHYRGPHVAQPSNLTVGGMRQGSAVAPRFSAHSGQALGRPRPVSTTARPAHMPPPSASMPSGRGHMDGSPSLR